MVLLILFFAKVPVNPDLIKKLCVSKSWMLLPKVKFKSSTLTLIEPSSNRTFLDGRSDSMKGECVDTII